MRCSSPQNSNIATLCPLVYPLLHYEYHQFSTTQHYHTLGPILYSSKVGEKAMIEEMYTSGEYLEKNPTWHVEESPWKAKQIMRMLNQSGIAPRTICEV